MNFKPDEFEEFDMLTTSSNTTFSDGEALSTPESTLKRSFFSLSLEDCGVALLTALTLAIALFFAGCSSMSGSEEEGAADGAYLGLSDAEIANGLNARYGTGSIPEAEGDGIFKDIRFGFDSYTVDGAAREKIALNVEVIKANPQIKIQLEGHCDERGTSEYNLALGQRRAEAVRDAMLALGVDRTRIETISYGSEVPLDPRSNEEAWALNRRVHFTPFTE